MYDKIIVQDGFGQHYTIQSRAHPRISHKLNAKTFWSPGDAHRFVESLHRVPPGYWQWLMQDIGHADGHAMSNTAALNAACEWMASCQPIVFAVNPPAHASDAPQKRTIKTKDTIYRFIPAVEQLLHTTEAKTFKGVADARAYLQKLNLDEQQLNGMASELDIAVPATANPAQLTEAIADSLASGKTAVIEETIVSATPPMLLEEVIATGSVGNRKADLGPHETEEAPKHWFAVQLVNEIDEAYKSETFTVSLSDTSEVKINGGSPNYRKEQLPSGKCSITFDGFYKQIEQWIGERSQ